MINEAAAGNALMDAITKALGHGCPFAQSELDAIERLVITNAVAITGIEELRNLRELELYCSDIHDLKFLFSLQKLEVLKIYALPIKDISPLIGCPSLKECDISFTCISDLSPLFSLPLLEKGILIGNPYTDECFNNQIQALLQIKGKPGFGLFMFPQKENWEQTRKFFDGGRSLCVALLDGVAPVLIKPGLPVETKGNCDFILWKEKYASKIIDWCRREPVITLQKIFNLSLGESGCAEHGRFFDFDCRPTIGNDKDAVSWINASGLAKKEKEGLLSFVAKFPQLPFYRSSLKSMTTLSEIMNILLPEWFIALQTTFSFIVPYQRVQFRFRNDNDLFRNRVWYVFNFRAGDHDYFKKANESVLPVNIAESFPFTISLNINVNGEDDRSIYGYDLEYVDFANFDSGKDGTMSEALEVFFSSYAEMLAGIESVKIMIGENETVFEAVQRK